jgi:pyruvate/2-oxoacid:ferredoxin oxidoreductase beta subunit
LYEVEEGLRYHINLNPKNLPVDEYLRLQGRFTHLSDEDIQKIQETVDREWERLLKKALDTI